MDRLLTLHPAYGRLYGTQEQMLEDWENGKDFNTRLGYCSIRDIPHFKANGIKVLKMHFGADGTSFILYFLEDHHAICIDAEEYDAAITITFAKGNRIK